jgi:hypothetical protein
LHRAPSRERRRECAGGDADGAAENGEEDGFGEELDEDVALRGAERAAEADLGAAFEDTDKSTKPSGEKATGTSPGASLSTVTAW